MSKNFRTTRTILIVSLILYIFIAIGLRLFFINYTDVNTEFSAEKGVIDLRNWDFNEEKEVSLRGEWEFQPGELTTTNTPFNEYILVPSNWKLNMENHKQTPGAIGKGTYRLQILLPENINPFLILRIETFVSAGEIFLNGKQINEFNTINSTTVTKRGSFSTFFHHHTKEMELIIKVSNNQIPSVGGIIGEVGLGTTNKILSDSRFYQSLQIGAAIVFALHSVYSFFTYFYSKRKNKEFLYYALMLAVSSFLILIDYSVILQLPFAIEIDYKIIIITHLAILITIIQFLNHLFEIQIKHPYRIGIIYVSFMLGVLVTPIRYLDNMQLFIVLFFLVGLLYLFFITIKQVLSGKSHIIFILFFLISYTSNLLWEVGRNASITYFPYYPVDSLMAVIMISCYLAVRHIRLIKTSEKQRKKLEYTDKLKDDFITHTSRELRNPIQSILNILECTLNKPNSSIKKDDKNNLNLIVNLTNKVNYLLDDISDVNHIKNKRIKLDITNVHLYSIAAAAVDIVSVLLEEKPITFKLKIPSDLPPVSADKDRLMQILLNLIHNAGKFTNSGEITIEAKIKNGMAVVSVKDTGIGIHKSNLIDIFRLYEKNTDNLLSFKEGMGLGLSITKELVELQGGEVSAESTPGVGSTFSFTLLLANNPAKELTENLPLLEAIPDHFEQPYVGLNESASESEENAARILIVDSPLNINIYRKVLNGYNITSAFDGEEAQELIKSNSFDLLIVAVILPSMSGYSLTKIIREKYSMVELPILLITSRNRPEDNKAVFLYEANDYISKPVNYYEFKARVLALTQLRKSVKEKMRFEAAWLQAQIKPHFIFNTLNAIVSLNEFDKKLMLRLLEEFGNYLRRNVDILNTESLIPVRKELDLVKSYLFIQKERFRDKVQINWDIDCIDFKIPPLAIQTIVENAVIHGILKNVEGGRLTLRIKERPSEYEIFIEDNGPGMNTEEINHIFYTDHSKEESGDIGIGLMNTDRRLKQLFGTGLEISNNKDDKGTIIHFTIPKV
ncbi:7TM diverse intracellular signalling [Halobacillus alkaliphilus]|uniref:histidine kinase n=1 Tax=Halobacillus alkaliphilus TaxID=396056 RepID=A0A1I2M948_9BACI|nr:ATP-binding protein [Halobacillus alkaliphilus]SFF88024.1 7TM diverse intracellular signalling [Halobacillus alkaliphilus]